MVTLDCTLLPKDWGIWLTYKRKHFVFDFLYLGLTHWVCNIFCLYPFACRVYVFFFLQSIIEFHCASMTHFHYPFINDRHLVCFHPPCIVSRMAMNLWKPVSLELNVESLGDKPRNGITFGSNRFALSSLRIPHAYFHNPCTSSQSHQQWMHIHLPHPHHHWSSVNLSDSYWAG